MNPQGYNSRTDKRTIPLLRVKWRGTSIQFSDNEYAVCTIDNCLSSSSIAGDNCLSSSSIAGDNCLSSSSIIAGDNCLSPSFKLWLCKSIPISAFPVTRRHPGFAASIQMEFRQECSPQQNIIFTKTHKTGSSTITNILLR